MMNTSLEAPEQYGSPYQVKYAKKIFVNTSKSKPKKLKEQASPQFPSESLKTPAKLEYIRYSPPREVTTYAAIKEA